MTSKVVSFQIVQGYARSESSGGYSPDVIALCADGSLWWIGLSDFQDNNDTKWKRMTPELTTPTQTWMPAAN